MFAAQNHGGMSGALYIDIMTMPGGGPMRGSLDFNFLDDALEARNPMVPTKGEEQLRQAGFTLSGTIKPNKTSFSMSAGGVSQYFSSNVLAALPDGTRLAEALRQPQDRWNFNARLDHAINKDHAVRLSFDRTNTEQRNLGVGDFNLAERGYTSTAATNMFRLSENGPLGRRFFTESRLQTRWSDTSFRSNEEAPTVQVNDAFTAGGAQMRGGRQDVTLEAATDLDYVRGNHSWRTGLLVRVAATRRTIYRTTSAPIRSRTWPITSPGGRRVIRVVSGIRRCGIRRCRRRPTSRTTGAFCEACSCRPACVTASRRTSATRGISRRG
jgi:hypothetical protein